MKKERVLLHVNDGIAEVCLNRPDKRNALDLAMFEGLIEAGKAIQANPKVRVVILYGEGAAFCAGLDFMSMLSLKDGVEKMLEPSSDSPANFAQRVAWIWHELAVPVIAVLHGAVFGGGLQIALGADIRIAASDTVLSVMEIKWGLCPDMTISQTLTKLVNLDTAKLLTFTGKKVKASEAKDLGLVTQVEDSPLVAARELAQNIVQRSPHAIQACKTLLNNGPLLSPKEAFQLEEQLQRELIGSPNQIEAMQANFMKRSPTFKDVEHH